MQEPELAVEMCRVRTLVIPSNCRDLRARCQNLCEMIENDLQWICTGMNGSSRTNKMI